MSIFAFIDWIWRACGCLQPRIEGLGYMNGVRESCEVAGELEGCCGGRLGGVEVAWRWYFFLVRSGKVAAL